MKDSKKEVFSITVSQGIAGYKSGDDEYSIISRADEALYKAKENGRNRIEIEEMAFSELKTV
jgi:diguanylate cyclase (GGDEF)-like protein